MNIDIEKALSELNTELAIIEYFVTIVVCGGASIVLGHYGSKVTRDIDFLFPDLNKELEECRNIVAKRLGYSENWLNNNSQVFVDDIPKNWGDRTIELLRFSHLKVDGISRQDLISSKLKAQLDRGFDAEDLFSLNITEEELYLARDFVTNFPLSEIQLFDLKNIEELILEDRENE